MNMEFKAIFEEGCVAHSNAREGDCYPEDEIIFIIGVDGIYIQTFDIVDRLVNGEHEQTEEWIDYPMSDVEIQLSFNGTDWFDVDTIKEAMSVKSGTCGDTCRYNEICTIQSDKGCSMFEPKALEVGRCKPDTQYKVIVMETK